MNVVKDEKMFIRFLNESYRIRVFNLLKSLVQVAYRRFIPEAYSDEISVLNFQATIYKWKSVMVSRSLKRYGICRKLSSRSLQTFKKEFSSPSYTSTRERRSKPIHLCMPSFSSSLIYVFLRSSLSGE